MKEFDFTHPNFRRHRPVVQEWIKEHHDKPTTEDEFVEFRRKNRPRKPQGINSRKWHRKQGADKWRREYRHLKNEYGFFVGQQEDKK